ncbi:MAG: methyltransferase domain-containing protein [Candidatus Falkowbacteria bacterium]|nr:methyltransferase domain-containing protein [Candidatus Falkowbacteria bacterium]
MKKIFGTKQVIEHSLEYINGAVCDLGTDKAKYKDIIEKKAATYTYFDKTKNSNTDYFGDPSHLPFSDASFDTVISCEFMEHLEKPWLFVEEINRILKSGGICVLTTPFLYPRHNRGQDFDYYRFTHNGLASIFKQNDFTIIESAGYNKLFGTIYLMIRSEYIGENPGRVKSLFFDLLKKITIRFDGFNNSQNIYSNSFVIAKKI